MVPTFGGEPALKDLMAREANKISVRGPEKTVVIAFPQQLLSPSIKPSSASYAMLTPS